MQQESLPLSVVMASVHGWPDVRSAFAATRTAADRVGGEVVIADGSGRPAPPEEAIGPRTVWISRPGASIFALRYLALRQARGEVVAGIEDHCFVDPDWGEGVLEVHREYPDAAVIGGGAENGSSIRILDWASYFVTQIAFLPPVGTGRRVTRAAVATVSYKRSVLERLHDFRGIGVLESLFVRDLVRDGVEVLADDRLTLVHDQSLSLGEFSLLHFDVGRTVAAGRAQRMDAEEWVRAVGALVIPWARAARTFKLGLAKRRHTRELVASAPLIFWLLYCQAAGHLLGYGAGPGRSPHRVV